MLFLSDPTVRRFVRFLYSIWPTINVPRKLPLLENANKGGHPFRHYQCTFCSTVNDVINSFANKMHWWYKPVQICKPIECKGIHACCSGSPKNWDYFFSTLWLLLFANTSHVKGAHNLLNKLNILSLIPQSSKSKILLRKSVSTLCSNYGKPILYSKQFL